MELSKDEQWVLDLFEVQKCRQLFPRQITSLWVCTFPHKELHVLRNAVKKLEQEKLVERTETGSLMLLSKTENGNAGRARQT